MKAIIEFNLPEDQNEYDITNSAIDMSIEIFNFSQFLRNTLKNRCDNKSEEYIKAIEEVQEQFYVSMGRFDFE